MRPSHHPNGSVNPFCSISRNLCEYTYTRMILSKSEESYARLLLNFPHPAQYEKSCSFQIVTGVVKGYWDASLGNSDLSFPIRDV